MIDCYFRIVEKAAGSVANAVRGCGNKTAKEFFDKAEGGHSPSSALLLSWVKNKRITADLATTAKALIRPGKRPSTLCLVETSRE